MEVEISTSLHDNCYQVDSYYGVSANLSRLYSHHAKFHILITIFRLDRIDQFSVPLGGEGEMAGGVKWGLKDLDNDSITN